MKDSKTKKSQWLVSDGRGNAIRVSAANEKTARAEAHKVLKVKYLPPGIKVSKL